MKVDSKEHHGDRAHVCKDEAATGLHHFMGHYCGSKIFMRAYDSAGSQMAEVFEGHRIPGNPQCNYKTSAGQTVPWHFGYKIATGRTPGNISVIDTNVDGQYGWGEEILASLK